MPVAEVSSPVTRIHVHHKMQRGNRKDLCRFDRSGSSKYFISMHTPDISCNSPDLSLSSAVKVTSAVDRCVLPGCQCHSTMYKHEKAHQGNWGFNNQHLGARRDQ